MDALKRLRSELERRIIRAWEGLTEGWRELLSRSSNALTYFARAGRSGKERQSLRDFPHWSLLAAEVWETAKSVIVRIEVPGLDKEDLDVSIRGNTLRICGDKHAGVERERRLYHLMERAYGHFERTISLPHNVVGEEAEVSYKNGVLTVIMPKTETIPPRHLPVR